MWGIPLTGVISVSSEDGQGWLDRRCVSRYNRPQLYKLEFHMKAYILLPFVLLAGLVVGGLGPRAELARTQEELKTAKDLLRKNGGAGSGLGDVTRLLGIERSSDEVAKKAENAENGQESEAQEELLHADDSIEGGTDAGESSPDGPATVAVDASSEPDREFGGDIDRAVELWQARVAIARSTFIANARLNDAQALKFDTLVDAMNVRIGTKIDEFAADIKEAESVQPEAGIRLVNEVTDAMVLTYDEMDNSMPQGWRRRAGEKFNMANFIDPEVARPMVGLEGKMSGMVVR